MKIKPIFNKNSFWASLWFAQIVLFFILSKLSWAVRIAARTFEKTQYFRTALFKSVSFSVGDVFYILLISFLAVQAFFLIKKRSRRPAARRIFILLNIIYPFYQIFWGLLYFESPLLSEQSFHQEINVNELKSLTTSYLQRAAIARNQLPETVFKINSLPDLKIEIGNQQQKIAEVYKRESKINTVLKPSLFSGVMSFSGISGYYNPFSSEAQYNPNLPDSFLPFTLAHEASHQIGFAREQEADFIAFMVGKDSKNIDLKYSTNWFVVKNLLSNIYPSDSVFVKQTLLNLPQKIKNDYLAEKAFQKTHEGALETLFYFTNDLFLKSNQQAGIVSYNYFIYLLLDYEKKDHALQHDPKNTNDEKKFITSGIAPSVRQR